MRTLGHILTAAGVLALAGTTPAWASGFQSYRLCGGSSFSTCAAVEISVTGNNVSMRVWNISQNMGATWGQGKQARSSSILDGIAFFNLPAGLKVDTSSLTVSGPGASPVHGWTLRNYDNFGAFALDARNGANRTPSGGIASGCGSSEQFINAPSSLMINPCTGLHAAGNWVTFNFRVTGSWNPGRTDLSLRSFDPATGESSEYWTGMSPNGQPGIATTVTPEPVTMTLLATGLAGMGGASLLKRRRKQSEPA